LDIENVSDLDAIAIEYSGAKFDRGGWLPIALIMRNPTGPNVTAIRTMGNWRFTINNPLIIPNPAARALSEN